MLGKKNKKTAFTVSYSAFHVFFFFLVARFKRHVHDSEAEKVKRKKGRRVEVLRFVLFFFFGVMRQQRQCRRGSAFALLNGCTPPPCRIPSKAPTHVSFLFFFFRVGCHLRITLLSLSLCFPFFFKKTVSALVLRYTNTSDICNLPFFLSFFFFLTLLFLRYANSFLFFFLFSSSLTLPPSSSLQHPEFFFFFFVWLCGCVVGVFI